MKNTTQAYLSSWGERKYKYTRKNTTQAYLSSNHPNLDLTRKGLKEDFSWMSSTQVLSKCSMFGELTTACWKTKSWEILFSQISFLFLRPWMKWNLEKQPSWCPCLIPSRSSRCSLTLLHCCHSCKLFAHFALISLITLLLSCTYQKFMSKALAWVEGVGCD